MTPYKAGDDQDGTDEAQTQTPYKAGDDRTALMKLRLRHHIRQGMIGRH